VRLRFHIRDSYGQQGYGGRPAWGSSVGPAWQEGTSRPGRRPAECAIVVGTSVEFRSALTADYQISQFQEAVLRPGQGERDEAAWN